MGIFIEIVVIVASGTNAHMDVKSYLSGHGTCVRHPLAYYTPQYRFCQGFEENMASKSWSSAPKQDCCQQMNCPLCTDQTSCGSRRLKQLV